MISEWFVEAANHCSGDFPRGADELAAAGLTPAPSARVRPPRVAEAAVAFECRLRAVHEVSDNRTGAPSGAVVIGEVVLAHVSEAVAARSPSGKLVVDAFKLRPVGRLGGVSYCGLGAVYDMARPDGSGRYPPGFLVPTAAAAAAAGGANGAAAGADGAAAAEGPKAAAAGAAANGSAGGGGGGNAAAAAATT